MLCSIVRLVEFYRKKAHIFDINLILVALAVAPNVLRISEVCYA